LGEAHGGVYQKKKRNRKKRKKESGGNRRTPKGGLDWVRRTEAFARKKRKKKESGGNRRTPKGLGSPFYGCTRGSLKKIKEITFPA
jgi:hypothetical protein